MLGHRNTDYLQSIHASGSSRSGAADKMFQLLKRVIHLVLLPFVEDKTAKVDSHAHLVGNVAQIVSYEREDILESFLIFLPGCRFRVGIAQQIERLACRDDGSSP